VFPCFPWFPFFPFPKEISMEVGMLWFDNDPRRGLEEKVARAVAHYKQKYGQMPTLCFVNPATLNGGPDLAAGVHIKPVRSVLPNHFWIGVGEANGRGANGHDGTNGAKKNGRKGKQGSTRAGGRGRVRSAPGAGKHVSRDTSTQVDTETGKQVEELVLER
jgi:hypothetical protein